jgi:hypothetical protein
LLRADCQLQPVVWAQYRQIVSRWLWRNLLVDELPVRPDRWPVAGVHEEALKVEQFALSDPRTACFYARRTIELLVEWVYDNDSQLERPFAAQTLADLM